MYSIYTGGYRAALRDATLPGKSKRYFEELAKVERVQKNRPAG